MGKGGDKIDDDSSVAREIVVKTLDFIAQEIERRTKEASATAAPEALGMVLVLGMVRDLSSNTKDQGKTSMEVN